MTDVVPKIIAVVVSYQPNLRQLVENLELIAEQVEHVVLVDNASAQQSSIVARCQQVASVMPQTANRGLGAAHNIGIEYAKALGATHVVLFDQDSQPQAGMIQQLYDACEQLQSQQRVSAVGPRYDTQDNKSSFFVRFGWMKFDREYCDLINRQNATVPADFLISSGSLIPLDSLQTIGLMDEGLFIDHVDTEWFLRARAKGFSAFGVCAAAMKHGLGEQTRRVKLIRERNVPQHKPFRYYYIFRNSVLLYRRSYVSKMWLWNDLQRLLQILLFYGLLYPPRAKNLRMMLKGIWHGMQNRQGQLDITHS